MKKRTSKLLSLLLALVIVLGMLPMSAFAADSNVISSVSINNVAEPMMGVQSSVSAKLPSGCDYQLATSDGASWFVSSGKISDISEVLQYNSADDCYYYTAPLHRGKSFDGKFESGKYYTFVYGLKPDEGCRFSDSVTATINGQPANVLSVSAK